MNIVVLITLELREKSFWDAAVYSTYIQLTSDISDVILDKKTMPFSQHSWNP